MGVGAQQSLTNARRLLDAGFQVLAHTEARAAFPIAVLVAYRRFTQNSKSKGITKFDPSAAVHDLKLRKSIPSSVAGDLLDAHRVAVMGGNGESDTGMMFDAALALLAMSEGKLKRDQRQAADVARRPSFVRRWTASAAGRLTTGGAS